MVLIFVSHLNFNSLNIPFHFHQNSFIFGDTFWILTRFLKQLSSKMTFYEKLNSLNCAWAFLSCYWRCSQVTHVDKNKMIIQRFKFWWWVGIVQMSHFASFPMAKGKVVRLAANSNCSWRFESVFFTFLFWPSQLH